MASPKPPERHALAWVDGESLHLQLPGNPPSHHHWWPINATAAVQLVELLRLTSPRPSLPPEAQPPAQQPLGLQPPARSPSRATKLSLPDLG